MRILVDITSEQVEALNAEAKRVNSSRAAVIRDAIAQYLQSKEQLSLESAFGMWADEADAGLDGLAYQEQLRKEW